MRLILATVAAAALMSSAHAEDAGYNWSGAYIGTQIGYDFGGKADYYWNNLPMGAYNYSHDPDGFLGGIYAGYNHQLSGGLIVGGEADIAFGKIRAKTSAPLDPDTFGRTRIDWSGSVRARLGYGVGRVMPYVAGGVAFTRFNFAESGLFAGSESVGLTGWTISAGADYAMTDNLIFRAEYRYSDFNDKTFTTTGANPTQFRVDHDSHDLRIGIAYKF